MRGAGFRVLMLCGTLTLLAGCTPSKTVSISTRPPDARIRIDGLDRGRGPLVERFTFAYPGDVHYVLATRPGYQKSQEVRITSDFAKDNLILDLRPAPARRVVTFHIAPVPAFVSINGRRVNAVPATEVTYELDTPADPTTTLTAYAVTVEAPGYQPARHTITWRDESPSYDVQLVPVGGGATAAAVTRRDLTILTTPPGADVYVNDQFYGNTKAGPVILPFPAKPGTTQPAQAAVRAEKPGYEPANQNVLWEDARKQINLELLPRAKTVRIITDPPGARVEVEGAEVRSEDGGASTARLVFQPVNEQGDMPTYQVTVSPPQDAGQQLQRKQFTIAWDNGQNEYRVKLEEAVARTVPLIRLAPARGADGAWHLGTERMETQAVRDTADGPDTPPARQVTRLPAGSVVGSLALSPDGSQLLFTTLGVDPSGAPRSQVFAVAPDGGDGAAPPKALTDGSHLDLTPTFTPDGARVVFASDRAGANRGLGLFAMPLAGGATDVAAVSVADDASDLWPSVDASPRPRVFFESWVKGRMGPALFMAPVEGGAPRTDLAVNVPAGASQPRVGPKADEIVFAAVDPNTGKRDLYRVSDQGGQPVNLTNTPDVDEFDPAWSPDGRRIAFASDRAATPQQPHNYDVWVMDVADPQRPTQVTRNPGWDDAPAFDVTGSAVYFRSNRGGAWQIWRSPVK